MREVGVISEMLFCYRLGLPLFLDGDQIAGGVPRHQAGRAMYGGRFDQLAQIIEYGAFDLASQDADFIG
ncbi:hypothetical protein ACFIOY_40215 [Bradyrhizobium sp. TZ2]